MDNNEQNNIPRENNDSLNNSKDDLRSSDSITPQEPSPQPPQQPAEPQPPASPQPPVQKEVPVKPVITPEQIKASEEIVTKPLTRVTPPQEPGQAGPPDSMKPTEEGSMDRRHFIKWLTVGWAAFAAIVAGYGAMVTRFMFPNVLFEPKQSFRAGFPDDYAIGEVSLRWKAKHGVWVVRDSEAIYALSTTCTHLGCTPNWLPNENKFKCPCHGSGFYKTGINFEGPAPRPLERFKISLTDEGEILIDKTKKFQQEKGDWTNPESFLLA